MSPNTMPSAASVSAASEDLRWRRSRSKGRGASYPCTAQKAIQRPRAGARRASAGGATSAARPAPKAARDANPTDSRQAPQRPSPPAATANGAAARACAAPRAARPPRPPPATPRARRRLRARVTLRPRAALAAHRRPRYPPVPGHWRVRATTQVGIEACTLVRGFRGAAVRLRGALRLAAQRVLGGNAGLQLRGSRRFGGGELLGGTAAALFDRDAGGELGRGARLHLLAGARGLRRLLIRRGLGSSREPQHLVGRAPLLGRALRRKLRGLGRAGALAGRFLDLGAFVGCTCRSLVRSGARACFARRRGARFNGSLRRFGRRRLRGEPLLCGALQRRFAGGALARTVLGLALCVRAGFRCFARRLLGRRGRLRALGERLLGRLALGRRTNGALFCIGARLGLALGGGSRLGGFVRRCSRSGVRFQPRLRRAAQLLIGLRAFARETARLRIGGGARFGGT